MKREELEKMLQQINVSTDLYNLSGVGRKDERYCLEFASNEWRVYYSERGVKTTNEKFTSEDAACEFIYEQLSN